VLDQFKQYWIIERDTGLDECYMMAASIAT